MKSKSREPPSYRGGTQWPPASPTRRGYGTTTEMPMEGYQGKGVL